VKAILVMDMPENCYKCNLCKKMEDGHNYCMVDNHIIVDVSLRKFLCPLKQLPNKREEKYANDVGLRDSGFIDGWNTCIDNILE
jgi:hypothetical protein